MGTSSPPPPHRWWRVALPGRSHADHSVGHPTGLDGASLVGWGRGTDTLTHTDNIALKSQPQTALKADCWEHAWPCGSLGCVPFLSGTCLSASYPSCLSPVAMHHYAFVWPSLRGSFPVCTRGLCSLLSLAGEGHEGVSVPDADGL